MHYYIEQRIIYFCKCWRTLIEYVKASFHSANLIHTDNNVALFYCMFHKLIMSFNKYKIWVSENRISAILLPYPITSISEKYRPVPDPFDIRLPLPTCISSKRLLNICYLWLILKFEELLDRPNVRLLLFSYRTYFLLKKMYFFIITYIFAVFFIDL